MVASAVVQWDLDALEKRYAYMYIIIYMYKSIIVCTYLISNE